MRAVTWLLVVASLASGCLSGGDDDLLAGPHPPAEGCPGSWYASFDLYVGGQRMSYDHPSFTLEGGAGMPRDTHLHRGNDWKWHFQMVDGLRETQRCVPFATALGHVDTHVSPGRLVLDGAHVDLGQAGVFVAGDGARLEARHRLADTGWATLSAAELGARQLADGERVILAFGSPKAGDWARWQDAADARVLQPQT